MPTKNRIRTVDDKGKEVEVFEIVGEFTTMDLRAEGATFDKLPEFSLADGSCVSPKGDEFIVVKTGQRLRRVR